ncbi:MAG: hypothetical protein Q8865_08990 [Bacillota bacterium]|nr:hypothetical protein [Bacillota bacterium]
MKNVSILIFEVILTGLFLFLGLTGKKLFFLQGARSSVITLGIIGMLLCTISVGKFISSAPSNPLTILGYIFGTIAMIAFLTQVFNWNIPIFNNSKSALIILAVSLIAKGTIARFNQLIK